MAEGDTNEVPQAAPEAAPAAPAESPAPAAAAEGEAKPAAEAAKPAADAAKPAAEAAKPAADGASRASAGSDRPPAQSGDRPPPRRDARPSGPAGRGRPYGGGGRRGGRDDRRRRRFAHRKVCQICVAKLKHVDYKDVALLSNFVTERGKIRPRRMSGACATHQRMLTTAIKRARNIALLPFKN